MIKLYPIQKSIKQYKNKSEQVNTQGILYRINMAPLDQTKGCMQFLKDAFYETNNTRSTVTHVKFRSPNGINNYTKDETQKWLNFIKSNFNLDFEYDGNWFTISKDSVKSGFKMYLTMVLIRYLWYPCYNIIDETFRILETDPKIDPFIAIQIAHYNKYANNPTFELFQTTMIFIPVTTEELVKDLELNEQGKITTATINYYFCSIPFEQTSNIEDLTMNTSLLFVARLLICKYYVENNFEKVLDVVNEINSIYKYQSYKYNTVSVARPVYLSSKEVLPYLDNFLHTLTNCSIKDITYIRNGTPDMIILEKEKNDNKYILSQVHLAKLSKLVPYMALYYNFEFFNILAETQQSSSLSNFLTFTIDEK